MYRNLWRGVLKVVTVAKGEWKQCLAMMGFLVHTWGHRMLYTVQFDTREASTDFVDICK